MNIVNYEAEEWVLGSLLQEGTLFNELLVTAAHFAKPQHQIIFRAMEQTIEAGQKIDLVSVTTHVGDALKQIGGVAYLTQLAASVPSTEALPQHEQYILEAYRNRKSRELTLRYSSDPSEEKLEQLLDDLAIFRQVGVLRQEKDINAYLMEIIDDIFTGNNLYAGFPTDYADLDRVTGGMQPGELVIIAARPSVGKTAFALNLATQHCKNDGMSTIFSLEMGTKQLLRRMISAEGQIHSQKWRGMAFDEQDYANTVYTVGEISNWKLSIHDNVRRIDRIRAYLRKKLYDHPEEKHIAIIDYLQLIPPTTSRARRDLEIGEITRDLKLLAVELNIPIILLSQLSRNVEQRQNKRPLMSDLRESGNIEQDADAIAFLYREDYYDKRTPKQNMIEIILAKQRNGPTGTVELAFFKEFGRFENLHNENGREAHETVTSAVRYV